VVHPFDGVFQVSIGLPSWFVRSDSKTVVVLSYVFVLVVVVPALVFYCKGTDKVTLTNQAIAGLHREQSKGCKLK
jgi:preprotein translocase subunit Sec63